MLITILGSQLIALPEMVLISLPKRFNISPVEYRLRESQSASMM